MVVSTEEGSAGVSAAVALVLAVFVAALWVSNPLQAESGVAVAALALAVPVLAADFAQPHIGMELLSPQVAVSAAQPGHSDITTEATAVLLLEHTNSTDGQINR